MVLSWWVHGASILLGGVSTVLSCVGGVPTVPAWCLHRAFVMDPSFEVHDGSAVPLWGPWCVHGASVVGPWWVHGASVVFPSWVCGGYMVFPWRIRVVGPW